MKPKEFAGKFRSQLVTLIVSAFSFVAALAWNEAITSMIKTIIPSGGEWPYLIVNACMITFIAVTVTIFLSKKA